VTLKSKVCEIHHKTVR